MNYLMAIPLFSFPYYISNNRILLGKKVAKVGVFIISLSIIDNIRLLIKYPGAGKRVVGQYYADFYNMTNIGSISFLLVALLFMLMIFNEGMDIINKFKLVFYFLSAASLVNIYLSGSVVTLLLAIFGLTVLILIRIRTRTTRLFIVMFSGSR